MGEHRVGNAPELGPARSAAPARGWCSISTASESRLSWRCRHLRADLADGRIDEHGCLVCPWHHARYNPRYGRMVQGPQGVFARVPVSAHSMLRHVIPLRRAEVVERDGQVFVRN